MDKSAGNWEFGFILPNVSIKEPIGNEYITICHPNDSRVQKLIKEHSNISYLIKGFTDQSNEEITPSVLIRNSKFKNKLIINAIIDFRNIYTICSVISGWQNFLNRDDGQLMPSNVLFSDFFNIYPIVPHSNDDFLTTISPAVRGFDIASKFKGQISPGLVSQTYDPHYDNALFDVLLKEWIRYHILQHYSDWKLNSLFRSLQIAYQSLSMPCSNFSTVYDYGTNLSLWVSAFEILAHPDNESVNLKSVLDLLDKQFLGKELIKRLYTIPFSKKTHRVNLVQKLYTQIYNARNSYMHGNTVKMRDLTPWGKNDRYPLYMFAPLVFKVALISKIDKNIYEDDKYYNQLLLERALLRVKSKKPKSIWDSATL